MKNYQHRDYLKMIINGLLYHRDYLSNYLKREQKKAEKDFVEFSEFIGRTITVVKDLEGELRRFRDQKKIELEAKKDGENDQSIEDQISNLSITKDISLPLEFYTEGEFQGSINFWDISKVRIAINEALEFYSFEKEEQNTGPTEYFQDNEETIEDNKTEPYTKSPEIDFDERIIETTWFKIGLAFATGQAQELYEKYKGDRGHFTRIAVELGFKDTDRPYISETINNSTYNNKNIYSSPEKLLKVYAYCQIKNIEVCSDFFGKLPSK